MIVPVVLHSPAIYLWLDHQAVAPLTFSTVFGVLPLSLSEAEPLHIFPGTNLVDTLLDRTIYLQNHTLTLANRI